MSDKTYIEGVYVREKEGQYGTFLNVSIDIAKLTEQARQHASNGMLNVVISKRRQPSEKGITHSVALDTYRRENAGRQFDRAKSAVNSAAPAQRQFDDVPPPPPADGDDVPF